MIKNKYLLLFLILICSSATHKFYLSLTQIAYVEEENTIQIIMNVFIDDMEYTLNNIHSIDLQLNTKKELEKNDKFFREYLTEHFHIKVDGNTKEINYLGKEYEGDNIFFYLEIKGIKQVKTIEVNNTILVKYFPKQQNLIKVKANKKNRSKLLTGENDKALLKF
ncbi:MAG: hypothetical protein GKR88_11680 [Flavobacteriaceae bacterium]|nr:MAG: hypothetical protein GKR88_11680 [Flavobacteriaceae bacterium]